MVYRDFEAPVQVKVMVESSLFAPCQARQTPASLRRQALQRWKQWTGWRAALQRPVLLTLSLEV